MSKPFADLKDRDALRGGPADIGMVKHVGMALHLGQLLRLAELGWDVPAVALDLAPGLGSDEVAFFLP